MMSEGENIEVELKSNFPKQSIFVIIKRMDTYVQATHTLVHCLEKLYRKVGKLFTIAKKKKVLHRSFIHN